MPKNYNVILIGIDTLRADHLGVYGHHRPISPNIDALASTSLLFSRCFSQAPVTAPSFMSLMTSRYPTYHGVVDNSQPYNRRVRMYTLDHRIPTLAEVLNNKGYRTAAFTEGGNVHSKMGFGRGFNYYADSSRKHYDTIFPEPKESDSIPSEDIFYWLKESKNENFFLFFHTYAVHNPWFTPVSYKELLSQSDGYAHIMPPSKVNPLDFFISQIKRDGPEGVFHYQALYDGAIKYVDDFIGKLLNMLDLLGMTNETIIVFTSDHGEEFFDHGRLGHKQMYNELLHIPLIIKAPHFQKPTVVNQIVRSIDIMPTILELLDEKTDFPIHGVSLLATLEKDLHLTAIAETESIGYTVQREQQKYIYHIFNNKFNAAYNQDYSREEFYDLNTDPKEKNNKAARNLKMASGMFDAFENELHRLPMRPPQKKIAFIAYSV